MTRIEQAKGEQGYVDKIDPDTCGNCQHFTSDKVAPAWMIKENEKYKKDGKIPLYNQEQLDINASERNMRCGIGGFVVKKAGCCGRHQRKEQTHG